MCLLASCRLGLKSSFFEDQDQDWSNSISLTDKDNSTTVKLLFNPLDSKGDYSATSNNMKLVQWPLTGGLLHLVQQGRAFPVLLIISVYLTTYYVEQSSARL